MTMDNGVVPDPATVVADGRTVSRIGTGIVLIVVGGLFFLDRLGYDWGWGWHPTFARMWPVLLIIVGLLKLFSPRATTRTVTVTGPDGTQTRVERARRSGGGEALLIVGVLLLLHQNRWLLLDKSWPLFIVFGGLSLLFGRGTRVWRTR